MAQSDSDERAVRVLGKDGFEQPSDLTLDRRVKATTTQQAGVDDEDTIEWYDPLFDPEELLLLLQRSETHSACVEAKAKGVAGHGFEIVPHKSVDPDSVGEVPDSLREFWYEGTFQLGPGALHATADEVQEHSWNDHEGVGWLAMEVLVNPNDGEPTGLAHVPAYTIRKRKGKSGYVQLDDGIPERYFGAAGDRYGDEQTFVDAETGATADSTGQIETVANELIVLRNYTTGSPRYGLPDIIPAIETLAGDLAAREFNQRFFSNDTVPRLAVVVSGGELTERAWNELEKTFRDLREEKNAHRGVLIEATSAVASSMGEAAGVDIEIEPLTVGVDEDAGFTEYRDNNEHYILQAHGVPPVVAGKTEGINFANAKSQRVNFAQTVIKPKQERLASRLYRIIHVLGFDEPDWTIEFNLHGGENKRREAETAQLRTQAAKGSRTINEARSELGYDPLEGAEGEVLMSTLQGGGGGGSTQMMSGVERSLRKRNSYSRREILRADSSFSEGDVVEIDGETGVIVEKHTSDFEAPTEAGETIDASADTPKFIVGMQFGGLQIVIAEEMSPAEFDDNGDPEALKYLAKQDSTFSLPEGWTRASLLDAWASMGGSFSGCVAEMTGEVSDVDGFCASMKSRVLGTEYWR